MQIVIDIPKEMHKALEQGSFGAKYNMYDLVGCVMNGILLPKGHGDLKDVSKIDYQQGVFLDSEGNPLPIIHRIATIEMIRDWLPTIIEADKDGDADG